MLLKSLRLFIFLLVPVFSMAQGNESIQWSSGNRLAWTDYLAKPSGASEAAAITSTTIGIQYNIRNSRLSYSITCSFSKTKSWGRYKTDYILQHEQGHFDITEIFARKLKKQLEEYAFKPSTYQDDVNRIYKKIMDEKEEYQNRYDLETDYSRNREKQSEWLQKISKELDDTEAFANYQSTVNL